MFPTMTGITHMSGGPPGSSGVSVGWNSSADPAGNVPVGRNSSADPTGPVGRLEQGSNGRSGEAEGA